MHPFKKKQSEAINENRIWIFKIKMINVEFYDIYSIS